MISPDRLQPPIPGVEVFRHTIAMPDWGYEVTLLENGDKIFSQWDGTSQTTVAPDGSKKGTFTGVRDHRRRGKYEGVAAYRERCLTSTRT